MSYKIDVEIKELSLIIPKSDLPLKNDTVIGFLYPKLILGDDEGSFIEKRFYWQDNKTVSIELKDLYCVDYDGWSSDLENLCIKYKGTLLMDCVGEDGEVDYIRIRDGIVKKVKIVEED